MNNLIVLVSYHHKNTEKVAQAIAGVLGAEIKTIEQTDVNNLANYDLIGFGSGVYFAKLDKNLLALADKLPQVSGKKAFIFSTSGSAGKSAEGFHKAFREKIIAKGYTVVGEFSCPGFDTYGVLKIAGGIKKGRPNEDDLKQAQEFAQRLQKNETKIVYLK